MLRKILIVIFFLPLFLTAQNLGPGSFARMGFYARGIGMGNAMTAVTKGTLTGFYNPAVSPFQERNSFNVGYSFLSLDRSLNFFSFTRKFEIGKKLIDEGVYSKPRSIAGISVGVINSGVSGIEERDNQGIKQGDFSTSENLFFLSLSNRFSEKLSVGITFKFFDYKLYKDVKTSGLGFDFGAVYKFNDELFAALYIGDINSKYRWDTNNLYGLAGRTTIDNFPLVKTLGASYFVRKYKVLFSAEFSSLVKDFNILRFGAEWELFDRLFIRGGVDELNLSDFNHPAKPSLGFSYSRDVKGWFVGFDYAFVFEPYSPSGIHVIGLNIKM